MDRKLDVLGHFDKHREYMEDRIKNGIENNRKGWAFFNISKPAKDPLSINRDHNVGKLHVKIRQKSHEFKYGANIFMLDELESAEKNTLYKKYFAELANIATVPIYWHDLEPIEGKPRFAADSPKIYRRPATDLCVDFCEANGIEPKAHCVNYDQWSPEWLFALPVREIKKKLERRMYELAERYGDRINGWEITNETLTCEGNNLTAFYEYPDFIEWSFKTAEKYFKNNKLIINDFNGIWGPDEGFHRDRSAYYMQIERAIRSGAKIDSIGMQYHMFRRAENEAEASRFRYDPYYLYQTLDSYGKLDRPIQITEVTIPCYTDKPEDEEIQAEIIKKLYRIWFSHANVDTVVYWNLADGYAAFAPQGEMSSGENYYRGGLLRFDMSPKPAYFAIKELFEKEWHTECEIDTNEVGTGEFKGFYGDYELEITDGNKIWHRTIELSKYGSNHINVLLD